MHHKLMILFSLICIGSTFNSKGQQIFYKEVNSEQGLPTECIYDLAKDTDGLFYLGTDQGVYTYNGIQTEPIPFHGSISNSVSSLVFTSSGTLWCRNFSDQVFYRNHGVFIPFKGIKQASPEEGLIDIKAIGNFLYIATFEAIYVVDDLKKKQIARIAISKIESIYSNRKELLVSNLDGMITKITGAKITDQLQLPKGMYRLCEANLLYAMDKMNSIGKIVQFSIKNQQWKLYEGPVLQQGAYINAIHNVQNNIVVSSNRGTYFLQKGKWTHLNTGQNHTDIIEDVQGGIWISTLDNGLIYIPSLRTNTLFQGLNDAHFRDIIPSPMGFFLSSSKGVIYEIDEKGNLIQQFDTKQGSDLEFIYFDPKTQRLYTSVGHFDYPNVNSFKRFYYGKGIAIDENNRVYFGIHSLAGVISNDSVEGITPIGQEPINVENISFFPIRYKRTRALNFNKGVLHVAYADKLMAYTKEKNFELKDQNGASISVVDMAVDTLGNLWCASARQGVFCYKNGILLKHFNTKNGLRHNQCKTIRFFNNNLYVVHVLGVDVIEPQSARVDPISAMLSLDHLHISDIIGTAQKLFFVTKRGLIQVLSEASKKVTTPIIIFQEIQTEQDTIREFKKTVNLRDNTVELKWGLLSYKEGDKIELWYRLKDYDNTWKLISPSLNSVVYNNLPAGNYTFEITCDKKKVKRISFNIPKPFWLTWWFITIEILLGVFILWITIRLTQMSVKKQQGIKELLIRSQLKALRSQMNPHFLYNVLNSLQGLIYSNKLNEAGTYVSMFSDHLRFTLNMSEKQYITIKEEMESLGVYLELEKLRFGDDFHYQIIKDTEVLDLVQIPSMIIQPFVENAVKHGLLNKKGDKQVLVRVKKLSDNSIEITIKDNGIGREQSRIINKKRKDKPASFATKAIDNRIDLLNKQSKNKISIEILDLYDKDYPTGTLVHVKIPINLQDENINS